MDEYYYEPYDSYAAAPSRTSYLDYDDIPSLVVRAAVAAASNTTTSSASSSSSPTRPPVYKVIGLSLAIASGLLIGTSFVLKKVGLLKANEKYNEEAGEGYGYLKNTFWWAGMIMMIAGEICNFVAYAFVDAILVTPLGALSVVVTTILSAIFLKERLSFVGKIGCFNCIVGSVVIVMNAPQQSAVADIQEMQKYVVSPGFLSYGGVIIAACVAIIFFVAPKYGKKSMLVYLTICSLIGGLSVVATQGLGSAIVAQAGGKAQFNQWFLYVLLVFVVCTLLTEIIYLNKALNLFNAALVTPTYYVIFTTATIVTSAVLFRGFHGTAISIATVIMGFLQICSGVVLLQLSKSAKDVPDAAVFKGDLDQVREVAEQEQPETEPKADAIRGAAALVRRFSSARQQMENREFQRLHQEKRQDQLEPLAENEIVEWDGIRRRKTVVGPPGTPSTLARRKSTHPPLGMSSFPHDEGAVPDVETGHGFMHHMRDRAASIFHPRQVGDQQADTPQSPMHPVALTNIDITVAKADHSFSPYSASYEEAAATQAQTLGDPTSSPRKTLFSIRAKPLPPKPMPSPDLSTRQPAGARRQFSFNNMFRHKSSQYDGSDSARVGLSSRGSSYGADQRRVMKNATEEERLGLVKGDSTSSPESSPESSPQRARPHAQSPLSPPLYHEKAFESPSRSPTRSLISFSPSESVHGHHVWRDTDPEKQMTHLPHEPTAAATTVKTADPTTRASSNPSTLDTATAKSYPEYGRQSPPGSRISPPPAYRVSQSRRPPPPPPPPQQQQQAWQHQHRAASTQDPRHDRSRVQRSVLPSPRPTSETQRPSRLWHQSIDPLQDQQLECPPALPPQYLYTHPRATGDRGTTLGSAPPAPACDPSLNSLTSPGRTTMTTTRMPPAIAEDTEAEAVYPTVENQRFFSSTMESPSALFEEDDDDDDETSDFEEAATPRKVVITPSGPPRTKKQQFSEQSARERDARRRRISDFGGGGDGNSSKMPTRPLPRDFV